MSEAKRMTAMFAEAHAVYVEAMKTLDEACELWDRGLLRKSAEKTWAAALQATNALILSRTGVEAAPNDEHRTYDCLMRLVWENQEKNQDLRPLKGRYATISHDIYQMAVCEGNVDPVNLLSHDIRDAGDYIRECERLAGGGG